MQEKRVFIVGAGIAGKKLLREINRHKELGLHPLGFIDDDTKKIATDILGIPVIGSIKEIKRFIKSHMVEKVLIALPSVDGAIISDIVKKCLEANVPCQIIPRFGEILEGKIDIKAIRDVKIDDLLGRPLRMHDFSDIPILVRDATILVTGAAGSIGSELCRQIASYKPKKIVLFDWWENGLYERGIEFNEFFPDVSIVLVIGNIQDTQRLKQILRMHKPSIVFHAAAYKHVPLMESHIVEAVKNNILGTHALVTEAKKARVKTFVFISTDKAVKPKSIMGMTKRIGELITISLKRSTKTRFICVRFGNVLDSAGSVLPLFRKQLPSKVITITDEKMTRFFMTIPEAVQLVLKATALGKENDIFVLDMGKPVKIVDMAKKFILLSGLIPETDVAIKYIGLRPGEKLSEELVEEDESLAKTAVDKIFGLKKKSANKKALKGLINQLESACGTYNEERVKKLVKKFIAKM